MLPWNTCLFENAAAHVVSAGGGAYTGPGDIASGAEAWWGLRAYSAAQCTGSVAAIRIVKASDGTAAQDINILTTGALDVATIGGLGYAVKVTKIYDQSGNGAHAEQATLSKMPALTLSAIGSLPAMTFDHATVTELVVPLFPLNTIQPFTISFVAKRTGHIDYSVVIGSTSGQTIWGFSNSADLVAAYSGALATLAATDGVTHAVQMLMNGTSSIINVDGTSSGSVNAGTFGQTPDSLALGGDTVNGRNFTGILSEAGAWVGDKSGNFAALEANQSTYWGL